MRAITPIILIAVISISAAACLSVKPGSNQPAGGDYEEFFLGSNNYQYFIKPLGFSADKAELELDITFRFPDLRDTATVNYTLITEQAQSRVVGLKFSNGKHSFESGKAELIYTQKESDGKFRARYSSGILTGEIIQMLSDSDWSVTLNYREYSEVFRPNRRSQRVLSRLESGLHPKLSESGESFFREGE